MTALVRHTDTYVDADYDYTIVDEAHHAQAPLFSKRIQLIDTKFLLGLTATPERLDKRSLADIFGHYETTLSIEEGIEQGVLSPFRVFRLVSDINLSEVRINGKDYVNTDLEKTLRVDSRNALIATTLSKYFADDPEKKGIIFCVNIAHAKEMAEKMNAHGLSTRAVSGKTPKKMLETTLQDYKEGTIRFLTAVNLLTEGFDAPKTNLLIMARPTLSKVVYLQQLGRGLRVAEGKDALYVIDVVDNYGPLGAPWTANGLCRCANYFPFINVVDCEKAPPKDMTLFSLFHERELALREIDIHTFEDKYGHLYSVEEAARELFINTGTLRRWIQKGDAEADAVIPFGKRKLHLFDIETIEVIRKDKYLKRLNAENIKDLFFEFLEEKTYSFSFKMVFLLALINHMDKNGNTRIPDVVESYRTFYLRRIEEGRQIDRSHCVYDKETLNNIAYMTRSMLDNPFEKFERKRFIFKQKDKDLEMIGFNPTLFDKLTEKDIRTIQAMMIEHLETYYDDMDGINKEDLLLKGVTQ